MPGDQNIMMSCKDFVRKISSQEKVTPLKKLELKFHEVICKNCSVYKKQIDYISKKFKVYIDQKIKGD